MHKFDFICFGPNSARARARLFRSVGGRNSIPPLSQPLRPRSYRCTSYNHSQQPFQPPLQSKFKMMKAAILALTLASASAIELTPANWDSATAGKSVFVKFLAPWCVSAISIRTAVRRKICPLPGCCCPHAAISTHQCQCFVILPSLPLFPFLLLLPPRCTLTILAFQLMTFFSLLAGEATVSR